MPKISTQQLTDTRIQRAPIKKGEKTGLPAVYYIWDSQVRGLGLRVSALGTKSFYFKFVAPTGEQAWMALGDYAAPAPPKDKKEAQAYKSPLDLARERARDYRDLVTNGKDPRSEKAKASAVPTLATFIKDFLVDQKARLRLSSYLTAEAIFNKLVLPVLGKLKVTDIERFQVQELHKRIGAGWRPGMKPDERGPLPTPVRANRMLSNLRRAFVIAEQQGIRQQGTNPCVLVQKNKESRGKTRFLNLDELHWLGQTLKDAPHWKDEDGEATYGKDLSIPTTYAIAAIRMLLATGGRLGEILTLRWDQVDRARRVLVIVNHKTMGHSGNKELPINSAVEAILDELEKLPSRHLNSPWVFQGHRHGAPIVNLQDAWERIRTAVGLASKGEVNILDVRIHDLRHTHASWGVMCGLSLPKVGNLLGHSQPSTTQRYGHFDVDPRMEASELIASKINSALGF